MEVGPIVRVARMRRGLTQAELSALVGVSEIAVRQIEAGRRDPSLKTLDRLLGALGLTAALHVHPARDVDADEVARLARLTHGERLTEAERLIPAILLTALLDRQVQFAVTGRLALLLHGVPVPVTEAALTLWDDDDNLLRTGQVLAAARGGPATAEDLLLGYDDSFAMAVRSSDLGPDGIRRHRDGWWMCAESRRLRLELDADNPCAAAVPVILSVWGEELAVPVLPAHLVVARDPALDVLARQAAERQQRAASA